MKTSKIELIRICDMLKHPEIAKYYNQAKRILTQNRVFLHKLSAALKEKKILTQREIKALKIS